MASGALAVLHAAGRAVPKDVAVAGFDDSGLATTLSPALTTVNQPLHVISREMVRLLMDVIGGGTTMGITIPTTVVVREST